MSKKELADVVANGALVDKTYLDSDAVNAIKDSKLKSCMKKYVMEDGKGKKAEWEKCRLIGQMAGMIKKDFGSDAEFAAFMGTTQSAINKRKRIAEFADQLEAMGYTVTNAFELLPVIKKLGKKEDVQSFIEVSKASDATQNELRELVKTVEKNGDVVEFTSLDTIKKANAKKAQEEKQKKERDRKAEKQKKEKNDKKLEMYYIKYVLPWLDNDSLIDKTFELSESDAKLLAKALMKLLDKKTV